MLGAGDVHRAHGAIHGELLLGAEHVLPATARLHSHKDHGTREPSDWLLSVGAVRAGAGGAALLCADHRLEVTELAVR